MELLSQTTNMGISNEFLKSISYNDFVGLLKENGVIKVADYFRNSDNNELNRFSIYDPFDLSIILSYWKLRYTKYEKIYFTDLLRKLNEEFSTFILHDYPAEICMQSKHQMSKKDFDPLSEEDRDRLIKEIEDDQKVKFLQRYLFNL